MKPIPAKRWLLLLLPLLILPALTFPLRSKQPRRELPHDAYIWQHRWTPTITAALEQNSDVIRAWRVLVAELDSGGRWWLTSVDSSALRRSGRRVILVIRIDGSRANWDEQRIQSDIDGLIYDWRRTGFRIAGVEIDHDSGVAGLKVYTRFIAGLRARLDPTVPLSITALPAWLASPDAYRLFAEADEIVLQVHAVQNPHAGLFDRARARDWIDELSRRTRKPFRVALPAYGSRVSWRDDGGLLAVESEAPLLAGGDSATELMASPQDVSALLRDLEDDPPPNLSGIVWFRLPTAQDQRAWGIETWRAVILNHPLRPRIEAIVRGSGTPGMNNLVLTNTGNVDAQLPRSIELPSSCSIGDGVNGYTLGISTGGIKLERLQAGLLRSRYQMIVGWIRCAPEEKAIHVRP